MNRFLPLLTVLLLGAASAGADDSQVDWKKVPRSQLVEKFAEALATLRPRIDGKRCLVAPYDRKPAAPAKPGTTWNFRAYATSTLTRLLKEFKVPLADHAVLREYGKKSRRDMLSTMVRKLGSMSDAEVFLVVTVKTTSLRIAAYASGGRSLGSAGCSLKKEDASYLGNTPSVNRRLIDWVESKMGRKVRRGECWDLPVEALKQIGSKLGPKGNYDFGRPLAGDETPLPGDVAKDANGSHVVVVRGLRPDGTIAILHQNWDYGKESGRKVAPGKMTRKGRLFWRPYELASQDPLAKARAIWLKAKPGANENKPSSGSEK